MRNLPLPDDTIDVAGADPMRAEKALLRGILIRALRDAFNQHNPALRQQARDWLADNEDPSSPFTVAWICAQLDLKVENLSAWLAEPDFAIWKSYRLEGVHSN